MWRYRRSPPDAAQTLLLRSACLPENRPSAFRSVSKEVVMHCQSSSCDASGKINCATVYAVTGQLYIDEVPAVINLDAGFCPLVRRVRGDRNPLGIRDASVGIPCAM